MILTAATATDAGLSGTTWLILTGAALAWAAYYTFACWQWPFAKCSRCDGTGKRMSPSGKNWGTCRRCKGKARRLRTGRKIFNWLKVTSEEAK